MSAPLNLFKDIESDLLTLARPSQVRAARRKLHCKSQLFMSAHGNIWKLKPPISQRKVRQSSPGKANPANAVCVDKSWQIQTWMGNKSGDAHARWFQELPKKWPQTPPKEPHAKESNSYESTLLNTCMRKPAEFMCYYLNSSTLCLYLMCLFKM